MVWKGKPLTSGKKGIAGSGNRKSRGLEGETADQWEKKGSRAQATGSHVVWKGKPLTSWKNRSWAQGEEKPLEKTRAQSPKSNFWNGGDPYMAHIWF